MKKSVRYGAAMIAAAVVVSSCGGGESAERTRNAVLPTSTALPYSCAQLVTDQATADTTEIRFRLCDDAELYSIVTPTGMNGSVDDKEVQGGQEVVVPVGSELNGQPTRLIVRTTGAIPDDPYHVGVHIYEVSLATADADLVGADSPLLNAIYPKVVYDMPAPQQQSTYRAGFRNLPGGPEQYAGFIDEVMFKWAMVSLATCHASLAHAVMATLPPNNGALVDAMMVAKNARNRDWYISVNALRSFVSGYHGIALCEAGSNGLNVISQGIEQGFTLLTSEQIAESKDLGALLKSLAVVRYWGQIVRKECPARDDATFDLDGATIQTLSNQIQERLGVLGEDTNLTKDQRWSAIRASRQIDVLNLLSYHRMTFVGVNTCVTLPAGYAVPISRPAEETVEAASATLPPVVGAQSQGSGTPDAPQPLAEIVTNPPTVATVAPSQLAWPEASAAVLTLRVGRTMSKAQLVAQAGLSTTAKSTVRLGQVASSKKVCTVASWGVKAVKAGSCKVRVSVATKGKKTQTKTVSVTVTK